MVSSNKHDAMIRNPKSALSRAMKKLTSNEGTSPAHHSISSLAVDAAGDSEDDSADEYQPDDYEDEHDHEDTMMMGTLKDAHNSAHYAMALTNKEAKQRHSDEQISFIILTRDNNKPDAFGASSETYGPLPWPGVAKAYNEKYGRCVGPAAMEKRVRQHRGAWMAKHLTYPINILYTKKPKAPRARHSEALATKPRRCRVQHSAEKEQVRRTGEVVSSNEMQTHAGPSEARISNDRIGGWVPPDVIRNRADMNRYIDQLRSAQIESFVTEVVDAHNLSLGNPMADRVDLLRSSAVFQRSADNHTEVQVQLHCSSIAVAQSNLNCVPSKGLTELPEHVLRDGSSLIKLYCFATQLEDGHVRELVLALWRRLAETNAEVNLGLEDLNLLFESTRNEDPARNFWAVTVYTAGLASWLVEMGECNVELIAEIQHVVARASV